MAIIVIDPGHGGTADVGGSGANHATGPAGTKEKTLTLDIGQRLAALVAAAGHVPVLTRDSDVNLGLAARAEVARSHKADVFLSIHFNGDANPKTQGTETWLHSIHSDDSALLAEVVQARLVAATGLRDRNGGHKKEMDLGVLTMSRHWAGTACCLAEVSFLTDPAEEERLKDEAYRDAIAAALRDAAIDFVGRRTHALAVAFGLPQRWAAVAAAGIGMTAAAAPTDAERQREAELWAAQAPVVDKALAFWNGFLGLRMGAATGQPLDDAALRRLRHIVRAVSWVESRHGSAGTVQPKRDPMQCGNPADTWWKELTGQLAKEDRFIRGPGLEPNYWARELPAAAAKDPGFPATAALGALGDAGKGHGDAKFTPEHSYWWGIPYLIHRINTQAGAKTYQCGDLSRTRLVSGAATYNGTPDKPGDKKYAEKLADALALIGDLPAPMALVASAWPDGGPAAVGIPKPLDPVADVARITAAVAPDCSFRLLAAALAEARTEILVYVYNLSARHIARALHDAIDRGVTVTLMHDTTDHQATGEQKLIDELADAGARVQVAPSGAHKVFTVCHQKFAVIDASLLVLGSANWAGTAFPQAAAGRFVKGNREWLVRIDDRRVAGIFIDLFWRDWALAAAPAPAAPFAAVVEAKPGIPVPAALVRPEEHRVFDLLEVTDDHAEVTPLLSPDNYFERALELIGGARISIGVEQQYILGEDPRIAALLEALKARADDGVSIRIIAAPTFRKDWERTVESVRRAGLHDHLRAINLGIFTHGHNKGVVVDDEAVIVSSTNWSGNSITRAREAGVLIRSPRIAGYFAAVLANDHLTGLKPDEVDTALATLAAAAMFDPDGVVVLPAADIA